MNDGEVCVMNIGPKQRKKRMRFGQVLLAISLAGLVGLIVSGAPATWRLALFLPFLLAATGYFQARDKT